MIAGLNWQVPVVSRNACRIALLACVSAPLTANVSLAATWTLNEVRDEIADTKDTTAVTKFPIPGGGRIEVEASCNSGLLSFDFTYLNETATQNGGPALLMDTNAGEPYVSVRTRLDQADIVTVPSTTKYRNVANVFFYDAEALWFLIHRSGGAPLAGSDAFSKFANALYLSSNYRASIERGAGSVEAFNAANVFRAEVPLSDGRKAVATIEPHDPVFQTFLKSCKVKGLKALDYDRAHPRPTCVAGENLYLKEGAVAFSYTSGEAVTDIKFKHGEPLTVDRLSDDIPHTFCAFAVRKPSDERITLLVSRSDLQTRAEWEADHAAEIAADAAKIAANNDKTRSLSIDEFEPTLRRLMAKYAGDLGIDPSRYETDIAEVVRIARTCASIRQSAVQRDDKGRPRLHLAPEQKVCESDAIILSERLGRPNNSEPRSLILQASIWRLRFGSGFHLNVYVKRPENDSHGDDDFQRFGILSADFPALP